MSLALHLLQLQAGVVNSRASPRTHCSPFQGLKGCSTMADLRQFHSQFIRLGFSADNDAMGRLIKFCALSQNGDLFYAIKLFNTIPDPDSFIYNTIMRGYLQRRLPTNCILLYSKMLQASVMPNNFTFPCILRACLYEDYIQEGKQIHAHVLKFGFGADGLALNNLIHMYVRLHALNEARRVFDSMPDRNFVSWTTMISGYSRWGFVDEAFDVFELMPERNLNLAAWNAVIAANVQNNRFHEAFALFDRMRAENVALDKFVAASMLSACTALGALEQGKWIHKFVKKNGIEIDSKLATAIIDMYSKCGCLEEAFEFFGGLPFKGISSWNSMIGGLAMHGQGEAAVELFRDMEKQMIAPDDITFVNLLTACAHSGLVDKGRLYFHSMTETHKIEPSAEHFGCMVDLLGRAGMLEEARKLIDEMPMSADASVLGAFLGACKHHKNLKLGEEIGKRLIELEPKNSGRYALLANLYATASKWEDVGRVRKLMNERGVEKAPGSSMIELGGAVNEFIAGEIQAHPDAKQMYDRIKELLESVKVADSVGCVAETAGVFQEDLNE